MCVDILSFLAADGSPTLVDVSKTGVLQYENEGLIQEVLEPTIPSSLLGTKLDVLFEKEGLIEEE